MLSRRIVRVYLATAVAALLPAIAAARGRNVSVTTGDRSPESCADIRVRFDEREGARAEEQIALDHSGGEPLTIRLPESAGVWVYGAAGRDYSLTACKAALKGEDLGRIAVSHAGGRVAIDGPAGSDWTVHLILRAPRDAALELEAAHGPIGVRDMAGSVSAKNENGPLSFKGCSGKISAETQNGPISLSDNTGETSARAANGPISIKGAEGQVRLVAQNGPISVQLRGDRWDGDLDAKVQNGPLSLRLPENFQSGVLVEIKGRGPFNCAEEACRAARKTWDDDRHRRIEFGTGEQNVRLSVNNGPVSIKSDSSTRGHE